MAPSFDWALSSLLCAEDNEIEGLMGEFGGGHYYSNGSLETSSTASFSDHQAQSLEQSFETTDEHFAEAIVRVCVQSDEILDSMIEKECQHLPEKDYLGRLRCGDVDLCTDRTSAVDWIKKVCEYFGFGPLCVYLSVNYLDRFLSVYELPEGKTWMVQLLAVACVSIAAKMEETEIPLIQDFQVAESKFVFEAKTIQRTELLVLSTLLWRMQAVTPFSYVDTFLYRVNGDQNPPGTWINKSIQLILRTVEDIDYLDFRPSEVAAAVAIAVAGENQALEDDIIEKAIHLFGLHAGKERVVKCVELLHDLILVLEVANRGTLRGSVSPIGVLDAACLSYISDIAASFDSCASSPTNTPDNKRRRISDTNNCEEKLSNDIECG